MSFKPKIAATSSPTQTPSISSPAATQKSSSPLRGGWVVVRPPADASLTTSRPAAIQSDSPSLLGRIVRYITDATSSVSSPKAEKKESKDQGCRPKFYCSYDEIISAIESWGKVEAILQSSINHIFIVSFKKPIKFAREGILVNPATPFDLKGMYDKDSSYSNCILSRNMMAFDIPCLATNRFNAISLLDSQRVLPDDRLAQISEELGEDNLDKIEEWINSTFTESDKAKKLLTWIERSGLAILERGLLRFGSHPINEHPTDAIVANYTSMGWEVVWPKK